jgi:hypothetical protein
MRKERRLCDKSCCIDPILDGVPDSEAKELKLMQGRCDAQELQGGECYRSGIKYLRENPIPWNDHYEVNHVQFIKALCKTPNATGIQNVDADAERLDCYKALTASPARLKEIVTTTVSPIHWYQSWVGDLPKFEKALDTYQQELESSSVATERPPTAIRH